MKIGRMTVTPMDVAKLRLRDWYSYHRLMIDVFKKRGPCELLWHFSGASSEGLHFVFLTSGTPVMPPYTDILLEMRDFPEHFLERSRYRFDVRMSMSRMPNDGKRRRVALTEEEAVRKFQSNAARWGFRTESLTLIEKRAEVFPHRGAKMTLPLYDLSGVLSVTDTAVFKRAALSGIGSKLSFGCGLLRLFPIE